MKIPLHLYNTLSLQKEEFRPIRHGEVLMYNCGPTLYGKQHIGNLSMFVTTDILRRTLDYNGYSVKQVINFTDFGHLSGDNEGDPDIGEDKMSRGLREAGMEPTLLNMRVLAEANANIFLADLLKLGIDVSKIKFPYASDYIEQQIEIIERLEKRGYTYRTDSGVYFDTSKFAGYGKLGNINLAGLEAGARVDVSDKRHPYDFILWKSDSTNGWSSSYGMGFPGWHIECTAMIFALLDERIDIHTGGIEHIAIHHNNEIAQAECATGKSPFCRYWLHREHIKIDNTKISKSLGNTAYLTDLTDHGIHPMAFRYFILSGHYSTPMNFSFESGRGAQNSLEKILVYYNSASEAGDDASILTRFRTAINDNLDTPVALALLHEGLRANISQESIREMDQVLGLNIETLSNTLYDIPIDILDMGKERGDAKARKDFGRADQLREEMSKRGFVVEDTEGIAVIRRVLDSSIV